METLPSLLYSELLLLLLSSSSRAFFRPRPKDLGLYDRTLCLFRTKCTILPSGIRNNVRFRTKKKKKKLIFDRRFEDWAGRLLLHKRGMYPISAWERMIDVSNLLIFEYTAAAPPPPPKTVLYHLLTRTSSSSRRSRSNVIFWLALKKSLPFLMFFDWLYDIFNVKNQNLPRQIIFFPRQKVSSSPPPPPKHEARRASCFRTITLNTRRANRDTRRAPRVTVLSGALPESSWICS